MGLFGGGNSANSTSNQTNNIHKDLVIGNASQGFAADNGGSLNVNLMDGGAINAAFGFAGGANALAGDNYAKLLSATGDMFTANTDLFGQSFGQLLSASNSGLSNILSGVAATQNFITESQSNAKGAMDSRTITIIGGLVAVVMGIYLFRGRA